MFKEIQGSSTALSLSIDEAQYAELQARLSEFPKKLPVIVARAINRAVAKMRTQMIRRLAKEMHTRQKILRDRMWIDKARKDFLSARVRVGAAGWPIIDFMKQKKLQAFYLGRGRRWRGGIHEKIMGEQIDLPHAFVQKMPSGHIGVFSRKTGKPLPIKEMRTAGPSRRLRRLGALPDILAAGQDMLARRLDAEADMLLAKRGSYAAEAVDLGTELSNG